jgi:two-component system response regulator DevR
VYAASTSILPAANLTQREQEVLALLMQRLTNEEIRNELRLAAQTVKNHVSNVLRKLGLQSRRELATRVSSLSVTYKLRP